MSFNNLEGALLSLVNTTTTSGDACGILRQRNVFQFEQNYVQDASTDWHTLPVTTTSKSR